MFNEDHEYTTSARDYTPEEAYVANEFKSFSEMYDHSDGDYDAELKKIVLMASNILNPTVPVVYDDAIKSIYGAK